MIPDLTMVLFHSAKEALYGMRKMLHRWRISGINCTLMKG